jgi:hypothetical protein
MPDSIDPEIWADGFRQGYAGSLIRQTQRERSTTVACG